MVSCALMNRSHYSSNYRNKRSGVVDYLEKLRRVRKVRDHYLNPLVDAFAEDHLGIEYRAEPNSEGPFGTEGDLVKESARPCVLTLILPTGRPYQAERIQVIREAASILTPLALNHSPCVIVGTLVD